MSNEGQMMRHPVSGEVHERTRLCDKRGCRPAPPPRDLNPYEWDPQAEVSNNACRTTYVHAGNRITAFARFLWWWQGLDLGAVRWGRTPDTVTVELDRDLVEAWAQPQPHRGPMITALSDACRAALDGENGS